MAIINPETHRAYEEYKDAQQAVRDYDINNDRAITDVLKTRWGRIGRKYSENRYLHDAAITVMTAIAGAIWAVSVILLLAFCIEFLYTGDMFYPWVWGLLAAAIGSSVALALRGCKEHAIDLYKDAAEASKKEFQKLKTSVIETESEFSRRLREDVLKAGYREVGSANEKYTYLTHVGPLVLAVEDGQLLFLENGSPVRDSYEAVVTKSSKHPRKGRDIFGRELILKAPKFRKR